MKKNLICMLLLTLGVHSSGLYAHGRGGGYRHGGHGSFGFYFGAPLYADPYYRFGYPYYYPPAVVAVPPPSPPVYIQQSPPTNVQYQAGYWYYCQNPEGYYPYVSECLGGWQPVSPTPKQ